MLAIWYFFFSKYSFECVHQSSTLEKKGFDLMKQSEGMEKYPTFFFECSYKKCEFIKIVEENV